ncbi:MAG TPA: hypothetical protein VJ749_03450 [Pyrinomonadaceae bacterium]|nr:hypothetical protein [Pyrinomonadaceae bacterium]
MPLPPLSNIIEAPLRLLGEYKVDCVIVGGVAAAIHGSLILTNERAAGRPKDLIVLPELEAIQEAQAIEKQTES